MVIILLIKGKDMTIAIADSYLIYYPESGEPIKILIVFNDSGDVIGFTYENGLPVEAYLFNILMEELGIGDEMRKAMSILQEGLEKINQRIEKEKPSNSRKMRF